MKLHFDNRFTRELPADLELSNTRRQVNHACFSWVKPSAVCSPSLLSFSQSVATDLGLTKEDCLSNEFAQVFSGNDLLEGMQPYAMCYGGHQFGHWAGQLGDGRAINLGEVVGQAGQYWALQLKGAGVTPYSRTADGLAVLRSSLREYLCSEAMHHLGVPTTRALSLCLTGELVERDMFYDGNPNMELGAVVCRVAPSFIRFGHFEIFASRKQYKELKQLADFTIKHHFANLLSDYEPGSSALYVAWFNEVCQRTLSMIIHWLRVGFVHGVMNTDNMSILGLTIDYGPYGWLDNFDPNWTPNTTDAQQRRYRFSQQPSVALWNLLQLANSLYPLVEETAPLEAALHQYQQDFESQWLFMMQSKLGLLTTHKDDKALFDGLETLMAEAGVDMTIFYRLLSDVDFNQYDGVENVWQALQGAYYEKVDKQDYIVQVQHWLSLYKQRLAMENSEFEDRKQSMQAVNPAIVFRNYLAQQVIDEIEKGSTQELETLFSVLRKPYQQDANYPSFYQKRPDWAKTKVGCSMLSCSS